MTWLASTWAGAGRYAALAHGYATHALAVTQPYFNWVPSGAVHALIVLASAIFAWWFTDFLVHWGVRALADDNSFAQRLVARARGPIRLAGVMFAIAIAMTVLPLTIQITVLVRHMTLIGTIILLGWFAIIALQLWITRHLRRFRMDSEDNLLARKHFTQLRILQRVGQMLIVLLTLAAALMTFPQVRQYGLSLLASAGAAGIVIGFSLQTVIKNLVAGIQLAITQPIRIDDALIVEGEWGNVEEITSTYVVIRIWDWRRLIVPLSYFIEKPFQNWTRESASLIGVVYLYTDFTVPVADLRKRLEALVHETPLWDGRVVALQVTDFKEHTMEVRMLASASNAGRTFDLRCFVREQMITYLQTHYPDALPRTRAALTSLPRQRDSEARDEQSSNGLGHEDQFPHVGRA